MGIEPTLIHSKILSPKDEGKSLVRIRTLRELDALLVSVVKSVQKSSGFQQGPSLSTWERHCAMHDVNKKDKVSVHV